MASKVLFAWFPAPGSTGQRDALRAIRDAASVAYVGSTGAVRAALESVSANAAAAYAESSADDAPAKSPARKARKATPVKAARTVKAGRKPNGHKVTCECGFCARMLVNVAAAQARKASADDAPAQGSPNGGKVAGQALCKACNAMTRNLAAHKRGQSHKRNVAANRAADAASA